MTNSETQALTKVFGELRISSGTAIPQVQALRTNNLALDYLLGGGLPLGRAIELTGLTGTGKTTLALSMLDPIVKAGKRIYIIDSENSIEPDYLNRAGIPPEAVTIAQTSDLNASLDIYSEVLRSPSKYNAGAFLFDTVAGLQPKAATEKVAQDSASFLVATSARTWSQYRSLIVELAAATDTVVLFNNHLTASLNPYGLSTNKPGGNTIPQIACISLAIKGKGKKVVEESEKIKDYPALSSITIGVDKSRFGTLHREIKLNLLPTGYDKTIATIEVGKALGVISGPGGNYSVNFGDEEMFKIRGLDNLYQKIIEDLEFSQRLTDRLYKLM